MTITVNKTAIKAFNFSGGECHVSIDGIEIGTVTEIKAVLYNSDDIMRLMMTVDAVRQINAASEINLTVPYFPYARQDRVCNKGEAFSAAVMADLMNNLRCASVTVIDPHSLVIAQHVKNCRIITQAEIIQGVVADFIRKENLILVSPDKGAAAKTQEAADMLNASAIFCSKVRETKTGRITHSEVHGDVRGRDLIILDDICDGGRTFIELAKNLKDQGAGKLYLYVTHGIFSKGLDVLKEYFTHVFCAHTFLEAHQIDKSFLTVTHKGE